MFSHPIIQSCVVFIFLTIFFFSYVSSIEKEEFEIQLDAIVDDTYSQYKDKIDVLFPIDPDKKEALKTLIYGLIDHSENTIEIETKSQNDEIDTENKKIIYNSIYLVLSYFGICIFILFIMYYYFGVKLELQDNLKESLFILVFIFLTEFLFLNIIAKNYLCGNANYVIQKITKTIIDYINQRKIN